MGTKLISFIWFTFTATSTQAATVGMNASYSDGNVPLHGFFAKNEVISTARPAVVIVPDGDGITEYEQERARMLADLGYVALAADIYAEPVTSEEVQQELEARYTGDPHLFVGRIQAAVDHLKARDDVNGDHVAILGYAFGGSGALLYALHGGEVSATVSFNGRLQPVLTMNHSEVAIRSHIAMFSSTLEMNSYDEIEAVQVLLNSENATWEFTRYGKEMGVEDGFTNFYQDTHNPIADMQSWTAATALLDHVFDHIGANNQSMTSAEVSMTNSSIHYFDHYDGNTTLTGFLSFNASVLEKRPAVVIIPDWDGINEYEHDRAAMLASMGYVGFVADIYAANVTQSTQFALYSKYVNNVTLFTHRIQAAIDFLAAHELVHPDHVAIIGYCFGGSGVLQYVLTGGNVVAALSFHGGLTPVTGVYKSGTMIHPRVAVFSAFGDETLDQISSLESELMLGNATFQITRFDEPGGVQHGFTNFHSNGYNAIADSQSWIAASAILEDAFTPVTGSPTMTPSMSPTPNMSPTDAPTAFEAAVMGMNATYTDGNVVLHGFLAVDNMNTTARPAVVIVPDWDGINEYEHERARMLAELGYVALAADIYAEPVTSSNQMTLYAQYTGNASLFVGRIQAAINYLKTRDDVHADHIAVLGYCFGGSGALMYALHGRDASATVSFHGGLAPVLTMNYNVTTIHSRVAIFSATHNDDTTQEIESVQMMLDYGNATWEITRFGEEMGVRHGFTNFHSDAYNLIADMQSWTAATAILNHVFEHNNTGSESMVNHVQPMTNSTVQYFDRYDNNTTLTGFLSYNASMLETRPAVVIVPDWDGIDSYEQDRADMIASMGYIGFVADIYAESFSNMNEQIALSRRYSSNVTLFTHRIQAAIDFLAAHELVHPDHIAIIGYCFGGSGVLQYALTGGHVVAAISFHGGLNPVAGVYQNGTMIHPRVAVFSAYSDEELDEISSLESDLIMGNATFQITRFDEPGGVQHGFTNFHSNRYNAIADSQSWIAASAILEDAFTPVTGSPTMTPSMSPTAPPTMSPTAPPTMSPTAPPTMSPTAPASISSTAPSTMSPTASPTMSPTTHSSNGSLVITNTTDDASFGTSLSAIPGYKCFTIFWAGSFLLLALL